MKRQTSLGSKIQLLSGQHIETKDCNYDGSGIMYLTGPSDFVGNKPVASKYTDNPKVCCKKGDILLTVKGSGTGNLAVADQDYCISRQLMSIRCTGADSGFVQYLLEFNKDHFYSGAVGLIPGISRTDVLKLKFPDIKISEQTSIASLLATWDLAIEKTERLIDAKHLRLKAHRERHLQNKQPSNRIKLHSVTRESTERNGSRYGREAIMAVTKLTGMRPMKEETIAATIERYKVVKPFAFAYNPMRLNIGSIAMSPFDNDVLVSPDYVVFECDESKLLPGYLNHLRFSLHWRNYFENAGSGSVRVRIYYDDLAAFSFSLPPVEMQRRIVNILDALVLEIDLLKQQADALRRQKRGLMQKLMTGAWQVKSSREKQ